MSNDGVADTREIEEAMKRVREKPHNNGVGRDIHSGCTDDAGQCARARRILAKRWTLIVWMH